MLYKVHPKPIITQIPNVVDRPTCEK